ncbi:TonB-dependent copper receptor [Pseudoxanthomonas sangjuensis]|uniref:TonB-dependent copper receptor n=1 Tax=Pseudoxanthomonas sangjuensis TaxID=1503750 RepID=UPI001391E9D1|nr:TonB-dependent copper receptor [Pseudoxanthomonas sangjuensis]KAF1707722.1 TonB-dependent copper receptor [Pseudoxanthomonas sangjuensis]
MLRSLPRTPASARLCAAVAIALSATTLQAATTASDDAPADPVNLDSVVVIGVRPVSPLTFETDPRQPRQPMPASDGADYLKTIPGFTAIRNGGTNGDPVLRGMFGSRLNLLTNEGAMPGACPARMDNPLSYVSPDTFDRLVVVKGPQTVLWGPGASAGTVRFSRDREVFDAPTLKGSGSLLAGSDGRNDQVADATWGAPRGYARVSANRSDSDDYHDGHGDVVPSRWTKWNADAAAAWTPDADTLLEGSVGRGDGEARYAGRGMDGVQFLRESQALRFERRNLPGVFDGIEANVYRNRADHVMDNYTMREPNPTGPMPMPMASNVERLTTGGRAALSLSGERFDATLGFDAQDSRHRSRNGMGRNTYAAQPWQRDATLRDTGVFGEATWRIDDQARIVAGARADRATTRDERLVAGAMGMPNPTAGQTRRETLAAGFVRYEHGAAGQGLSWYAGVGQTERMPDYWELFSANRGPDGAVNAFAGVGTERTTQLDVGLQYRTARIDAWVSGYAGRIDGFVLFDYLPGGMMGTTTVARNVDANIHGAEAGMAWKPSMHWRFEGTLAWAWGENATEQRPLPQMSPLEARLGAEWDGHGRWSAGALLRGVARQSRVAPGQGNVVARDLGPTAGFGTLAVHAAYRIDDVFQLTAGVDNLFDRYYAEHLTLAGSAAFGYPADPVRIAEPGRTLWLRLGAKY